MAKIDDLASSIIARTLTSADFDVPCSHLASEIVDELRQAGITFRAMESEDYTRADLVAE